MANTRYIITRSNYTLKSKHKTLNNGNSIYERDYMITGNFGGYDSGSIPWGEGNFKFIHNINPNNTRSFNNGKWITNSDGSTVWTLGNIGNTAPKEESRIVIKTNQNNFSDFVYFGSCVELVKTSLVNIINYYPAELFVTNKKYRYYDKDGNVKTLGEGVFSNPVEIDNPFHINISNKRISDKVRQSDTFNSLRYFADSLNKYNFISPDDDVVCFSGWDVVSKKKKCFNDGDLLNSVTLNLSDNSGSIVIYEYYFTTGNILITEGMFSGYHIRPIESAIEDAYNEQLSSFERFLLNKDSKPKFTISVDVPRETEYGIQTTRQNITFPSVYGWNLDIVSAEYSIYVGKLNDIAVFYDEHYSNNLWENIVHESIKNMDTTFSNPSKDEDISDYRLGISNVHGLMLAYGRQFDDIKLSIENIKSVNTITYDENNNIPDYLLSDTLELSGWEVSSAVKSLDETVSVNNLFAGNSKEYNTENLNTEFMRNLKLNSKAILERKGNRQSIEMLLALFGMSSYEFGKNYYNCLPETSKIISQGVTKQWDDLTEEEKSNFYDYKFNEYVVVAQNNSGDVVPVETTLPVEEVNSDIKGDSTMTLSSDGYCSTEQYESYNPLVGLPVRMVYITNQVESGETETLKYIIPWFDNTVEYDGKTYFQMYGGWNKVEEYDNNQYTETLKYLNILDNIGQLSRLLYSDVTDGEIYYVNNIADYKKFYPNHPDGLTPSHYFYLQNREACNQYGDLTTGGTYGDGWQIIPENDVKNKNGHGVEVYHLENIIDEYRGNNPHVGFGKYDDGDKYLRRLAQVFDGAIDDGDFDGSAYICETGEVEDWVREIGFTLTDKLVDNVKCWYFVDNTNPNNILELQEKYTEIVDTKGESYEIPCGYEEKPNQTTIYVGKQAVDNKQVHLSSDLDTFDLETQETSSNDEAAANSVINIKNISIEFNKYKYNTPEFQTYLHEVIMKYLSQIIPTTSMLTIKYIGDDEFTVCDSTPTITGVSK